MNHQHDEPRSVHGPCPSRDALSGFVLGNLSPQSIEAIGQHIDTCVICQKALDTLDALEDSVVADLKEPVRPCPADPQLEEQIRRAEEISQVVWQRPKADELEESLPARLGQYEILEKIGRGGMGTVYKAMHTRLKRLVALKLLPGDRTQTPEAVARFQREMEAVGRLDHPHLVRAHDAGEAEGQHYLAMEFVDGINVARLIRQGGRLPVANACEVIRQAALGLQHAHEHGLVHRDVKPSNLMLTEDGQIKVLDLGLARLTEEVRPDQEDATATGQVFGTGDFIAPEQGQDPRQADSRSDIYSLGCTLYFLLAGHAPFSGPEWNTFMKKVMAHAHTPIAPITSIRGDIPEPVATILARMTAKSPGERFQSAGEVARSLEAYAAGNNLKDTASERASWPPEREVRTDGRMLRGGLWITGLVILFALGASQVYRHATLSLRVLRSSPDSAESTQAIEDVNADLRATAQDIHQGLTEIQRDLDTASRPSRGSRPANSKEPVDER